MFRQSLGLRVHRFGLSGHALGVDAGARLSGSEAQCLQLQGCFLLQKSEVVSSFDFSLIVLHSYHRNPIRVITGLSVCRNVETP